MSRVDGQILKTTNLSLANHTASGIWKKNIRSGVLARLAPQLPDLKTGQTDMFTFTGTPKMELVGESAEKSNTGQKPTKVVARTYKLQYTHRESQEVMWADEDYQIGLMQMIAENVAAASSRALDLLAIHGVNPLTGNTGGVTDYLVGMSGNKVHIVNQTSNADTDMKALASQINNAGYVASGLGLDPTYASVLSEVENGAGVQKYPELGFGGFNTENVRGLTAAVSNTVSGSAEGLTTGVKAVMGDFSSFKWGIARNIPLSTILYGDPDGNGDLQRHNEVAFRAEIVIGFAFLDSGDGFSLLQNNAS